MRIPATSQSTVAPDKQVERRSRGSVVGVRVAEDSAVAQHGDGTVVAHRRLRRREDVYESKGGDGSRVEFADLEVAQGLLHFVFG